MTLQETHELSAGNYPGKTSSRDAEPFHLGMPHMNGSGVSHSWLLREACHWQWSSIAARFGVRPSQIRDMSGKRVMASVIACTINGDATAFGEDDLCWLTHTCTPSPENGWRGQLDLTSDGKALRVEIVTAFAKRDGVSNTQLIPADMEDFLAPHRDGDEARRTNLIRTLGKRDLLRARDDNEPPHMSFNIDSGSELNGVGLVYFSALQELIAKSEANAVPDLGEGYPLNNRRVHFFGNLDAGDTLDVTSRASVSSFTGQPSVIVQHHARRRSDARVIVCAESIYGQPSYF